MKDPVLRISRLLTVGALCVTGLAPIVAAAEGDAENDLLPRLRANVAENSD